MPFFFDFLSDLKHDLRIKIKPIFVVPAPAFTVILTTSL
jgi:hypothetical protein